MKVILRRVPAARKIARRLALHRAATDVFSAAVEITNICNLKCGFCPNQMIGTGDKYTISHAEFERILSRISILFHKSGKKEITFSPSGLGEVFLVSKIEEYLRTAKGILPGAKTDIASNFTNIDEAAARIIVRENLVDNLTCSMNYSDRAEYSRICGRDALPDVFEALDIVTEMMREYGSGMNLNIAMKSNSSTGSDEKREFEAMAGKRWGDLADVWWSDVMNWGTHLDLSSFSVDPDSRLDFPCFSLFQMKFFVNGEGDIFPCCCCAGAPGSCEELRLGNVHTSTWRSIRRRFRRIRNMHLQGEWDRLPLCAECNIYTAREFDLFFKFGGMFF